MFKQWNARLLAISAALALSACATQQAAAPVNNGNGSSVSSAYNQAASTFNTAVNDVSSAINNSASPYGTTYTPNANVAGQPTYTAPTYTPPPVNTANNGQYGRIGGQYVPNYSAVDASAATHIVQPGDTVYNISKRYGISQDTLRSLNGLSGNTISLGQTLRVKSGGGNTVGNTTPITMPTTPVNTSAVVSTSSTTTSTAAATAAAVPAQTSTTVSAALPVQTSTTVSTTTPSSNKITTTTTTSTISTTGDSFLPTQNVANIVWQAPTSGKITRAFGGDNKGVDIAGTRGQNVVAAADGQVVYSDSGLRGYGNLVIIQHTPSYLTAYGHNDSLSVREGESVKRGQVIAKMGQTDSPNGVKLHFEVRENGTPVDPTRFVKF